MWFVQIEKKKKRKKKIHKVNIMIQTHILLQVLNA